MPRFKCLLIASIFTVVSLKIEAQPPCFPNYGSIYFSINYPAQLPPVSTGMPYSVLIGHIALDSLCRSLTPGQLDSIIYFHHTYDDTVKTVMKYALSLFDFDPTLLRAVGSVPAPYFSRPYDYNNALWQLVKSVSTTPNIDGAIFGSHFICRVNVTNVRDTTDSTSIFASNTRIVTSIISDTILGRVFPLCTGCGGGNNVQFSNPPSIPWLQFDVRWDRLQFNREMLKQPSDSADIDSLQIQTGDYLVFLRIELLCNDTTKAFYKISPAYNLTPSCGVYRIAPDGSIKDTQSYFGLGSSPSVAAVISTLKSRITAIKEWGN